MKLINWTLNSKKIITKEIKISSNAILQLSKEWGLSRWAMETGTKDNSIM